jgi:hypothetical protein
MQEYGLFNKPDIAGKLLHQQVERGKAEALQALLEFFRTNFSANFTEIINADDEVRCTPLIKAAANAHANPKKTQILLDYGADVMRESNPGNTAIAEIAQNYVGIGLFNLGHILPGKLILEHANGQGQLTQLCRIRRTSVPDGNPLEVMMKTLLDIVRKNNYPTYLAKSESIEALKAFIALLISGTAGDDNLLNAITIQLDDQKKILGTPLDAAYAYLGGVVAKIKSVPKVDKINYFHFLDVGISLVNQLSGAGAQLSQNDQLMGHNSEIYEKRQRKLTQAQELLNSLLGRIPNS